MKYFRLGLLIFGVGAIVIPLGTTVLSLAVVGIDSFFTETLGILSSGAGAVAFILCLVLVVGSCVWAGWVSVNPAGLRVWPAAVFGGGLIGLGWLFAGRVMYWFMPHMHRPMPHHPHYPLQYVLLAWLSWLLWLAVPILLAYIGAAQAHKKLHIQDAKAKTEVEEDGFDPEIDHEPDPVFDDESDSETPPDPE